MIKAEKYLTRALENYNLYLNNSIINNEILDLYRIAKLYILKKILKKQKNLLRK